MDERELVARLSAGPASGADLARAAGLTRAAVWKQVQALRAAGLPVEAVPGRGYALARAPEPRPVTETGVLDISGNSLPVPS